MLGIDLTGTLRRAGAQRICLGGGHTRERERETHRDERGQAQPLGRRARWHRHRRRRARRRPGTRPAIAASTSLQRSGKERERERERERALSSHACRVWVWSAGRARLQQRLRRRHGVRPATHLSIVTATDPNMRAAPPSRVGDRCGCFRLSGGAQVAAYTSFVFFVEHSAVLETHPRGA